MRTCFAFAACLTLLGCDSDGYLGSHAPQSLASEAGRQDAGPAGGQAARAGDLVSGLAERADGSETTLPPVDAGGPPEPDPGGGSDAPMEEAPMEAAPVEAAPVDASPDAAVAVDEPVHDAGIPPDAAISRPPASSRPTTRACCARSTPAASSATCASRTRSATATGSATRVPTCASRSAARAPMPSTCCAPAWKASAWRSVPEAQGRRLPCKYSNLPIFGRSA
jgi:hypothetical protein